MIKFCRDSAVWSVTSELNSRFNIFGGVFCSSVEIIFVIFSCHVISADFHLNSRDLGQNADIFSFQLKLPDRKPQFSLSEQWKSV